MNCPFCEHDQIKVVDKRSATDNAIRRRRECLKCERRFTSYEKIEPVLLVIKKDGTKEKFSKDKIKNGILFCGNFNDEQLEPILSLIEKKMIQENEVMTNYIGKAVLKFLKKTDKMAYLRFASVYKDFDLEDFDKELKKLR